VTTEPTPPNKIEIETGSGKITIEGWNDYPLSDVIARITRLWRATVERERKDTPEDVKPQPFGFTLEDGKIVTLEIVTERAEPDDEISDGNDDGGLLHG
jgi:hypothetical protein